MNGEGDLGSHGGRSSAGPSERSVRRLAALAPPFNSACGQVLGSALSVQPCGGDQYSRVQQVFACSSRHESFRASQNGAAGRERQTGGLVRAKERERMSQTPYKTDHFSPITNHSGFRAEDAVWDEALAMV
jgi:hypothetical protein